MSTTTTTIKDEAHRLVDQLPSNATWDDLRYQIYVRESIEKGLKDSAEGNVKDVGDIRAKYGLPR